MIAVTAAGPTPAAQLNPRNSCAGADRHTATGRDRVSDTYGLAGGAGARRGPARDRAYAHACPRGAVAPLAGERLAGAGLTEAHGQRREPAPAGAHPAAREADARAAHRPPASADPEAE